MDQSYFTEKLSYPKPLESLYIFLDNGNGLMTVYKVQVNSNNDANFTWILIFWLDGLYDAMVVTLRNVDHNSSSTFEDKIHFLNIFSL